MNPRIFISYNRADKDKVYRLMGLIEEITGEKCWINRYDIACGAQNQEGIQQAINNSEIVLIMYSKAYGNIADLEKDFTVRELNFATSKGKRIVFVNIDGSPLSDAFAFDYSTKQQVDGRSKEAMMCFSYDLRRDLSSSYAVSNCESANYESEPPCGESSCSPMPSRRRDDKKNIIINPIASMPDDLTTFSPKESKIEFQDSAICAPLTSSSSDKKSIFNLLGRLFKKRKPEQPVPEEISETNINACVYAPAEARLNKSFIIRVYMYMPDEKSLVDSKVKEIDPSAVKKEYKPLDIPVKDGSILKVKLDLSEGVECKTTTKTVVWRNHFTDCSFMAKLVDENQKSIDGTVTVYVNDLPAGEMLFTIDVVETEPRDIYSQIESHRFSKIFISYAHEDENQVRGIAEGCKMLGKDYFFDRHTLKAGDIFKEKIFNYIDSADLFVLCWSKNAAESEWVQIEREHALRLIREGKSRISIYPLCLRPEAPLPIDMSSKYNFGNL